MPLPVTYCTIDGCDKKNFGHGMCSKHYARNRTHGSPHTVKAIVGNPELAFWSKVEKTDTCWNWTASKNALGYGYIGRGTRTTRPAHRVSYEMANGTIPEGLVVDHMCHNPSCVNPAHLQAVTQEENAQNRYGAEVRSRSGIRGVSWSEALKCWYVQVKHRGVNHSFRGFRTAAHAERVAIEKRLEILSNSVRDKGLPEFAKAMHGWHSEKHTTLWTDCPYEPCSLFDLDFRDAWSK